MSEPTTSLSVGAKTDSGEFSTVIEPRSGWQVINWRELREGRDLLVLLVMRDIRVRYQQTVLGFAWAIIQPVFSMILFTLVFGKLAQIPSDGVPYPIFSYAALVPWTYFATSLTMSSSSLVRSSDLLTKVYFPRLYIPATPVLAALADFLIALVLVFVLMAVYGMAPTSNIVFLPLMVLMMVLAALGVGMWLSALALQYRDVPYAVGFLVQILMYGAPVVWPVSLIPEAYRLLYGLYPMAGVIEGFRSALIGTNPMPWDLIGISCLSTLALFATGALFFRRKERFFADVA